MLWPAFLHSISYPHPSLPQSPGFVVLLTWNFQSQGSALPLHVSAQMASPRKGALGSCAWKSNPITLSVPRFVCFMSLPNIRTYISLLVLLFPPEHTPQESQGFVSFVLCCTPRPQHQASVVIRALKYVLNDGGRGRSC